MNEHSTQGVGSGEVTHVSAIPRVKEPRGEPESALIGAALKLELRGRLLFLIRLGWAALVVGTLALFLLTMPARYSHLLIIGAENSIALKDLGLDPGVYGTLIGTLDGTLFLAFTVVGALIFARKSDEWIGLFSSLALITAVVAIIRPADSLLFVETQLRIPLLLVFAVGVVTILAFVYIFPDGHFAPSLMRWPAYGLLAFAVYSTLARTVLIQPMRWPPEPISPVIILGILLGVVSQVYRFRRQSDPVQKQQTKWVIYGLSVAAVGMVAFLIVVPVLVPDVNFPGAERVLYVLIGVPLFYLSLMMLPLSLAVSILRYRLWRIDLIISRTVVYVLLTGILAGLFAALEKVTQDVFTALTGAGSDFATVISTLVVVAAFTPVKDLLQKVVSSRWSETVDPADQLKTFGDRVQARVSPIHPGAIARRLVVEAAAAYRAKGGAVYVMQGGESHLLQTVGAWDGEAALCIPLESQEGAPRFGMIALDDRLNGAQYSEEDRQALTALAQIVARALEEDQALLNAMSDTASGAEAEHAAVGKTVGAEPGA